MSFYSKDPMQKLIYNYTKKCVTKKLDVYHVHCQDKDPKTTQLMKKDKDVDPLFSCIITINVKPMKLVLCAFLVNVAGVSVWYLA